MWTSCKWYQVRWIKERKRSMDCNFTSVLFNLCRHRRWRELENLKNISTSTSKLSFPSRHPLPSQTEVCWLAIESSPSKSYLPDVLHHFLRSNLETWSLFVMTLPTQKQLRLLFLQFRCLYNNKHAPKDKVLAKIWPAEQKIPHLTLKVQPLSSRSFSGVPNINYTIKLVAPTRPK